ncbi:hypothetical protein BT96DRAFT_697419 [Gymnopus androsaceus JB14]|uniref:Uncharacterized protein n=1 Tax=Gymnopus androsaceus JB14 TaxID=1447944 RepID=A0A6A4ICI5_9AGAR|nr:hypothetical protein BT96DRAFT_697419 [Gymnopus androsaceus JB14]
MNRYPFPNYEGQFISPICGFTWTCIIVWRTVPTTLSVREQEIPDKGPAVLSRAAPAASRLFFSLWQATGVCFAITECNLSFPYVYHPDIYLFLFAWVTSNCICIVLFKVSSYHIPNASCFLSLSSQSKGT